MATDMTQMSYKEALDFAIFAVNTIMEPSASTPADLDRLEEKSDEVISTLVDMRETVQALK